MGYGRPASGPTALSLMGKIVKFISRLVLCVNYS